MAFFLSTKGQLHPYQFKYLKGDFEKARLERTEIRSEFSKKMPRTLPLEQTDFFAIDIMTSVLVVAEEETPLAHVARVLLEEKISALPIIDKSHRLVGIISRTDILKTVVYNRLVLK